MKQIVTNVFVHIRRYRLLMLLILFPLLILVYEWSGNSVPVDRADVNSGVIDLRERSMAHGSLLQLNGEWLSRNMSTGHTTREEVPDRWQAGERGFREYTLKMILPASTDDWGMAVGNIISANRLLINGRLAGQSGVPALSAKDTVPLNKPYYVFFDGSKRPQTMTLTLQVANHSVYAGGFIQPLLLATQKDIQNLQARERSKDLAVASVALCFSLFSFGIFLIRRNERTSLYFSLMSLSLAIHALIFSQRLIYEWLPFLSFSAVGTLQFMNALSLVFFIKFYRDVLNDSWLQRISPWVDKGAWVLLAVFLLLPHSMLTRFAGVVALLIFFTFSLLLLVSVRALFRHSLRSSLILLGFSLPVYVSLKLVLFLVLGVDSYADVTSINPLVIPLFIFTQAIVIAQTQREQEVQIRQASEALIKSEIAFLRAQIKPHFLYNALNTLMWATDKSPEQTKYLIFHLSNVLRASYHFDYAKQVVPFTDEITIVRSYLIIEEARFADRLVIQYDLETEDFMLPPFVLQPLVENALQHGILVKHEGGQLTIGTRRVQGEMNGIEVYIEDDGPGMTEDRFHSLIMNDVKSIRNDDSGSVSGVGLPNVHMRLLRINHSGLRLEQVKPSGARIVFFIKSNNKNDT